MIVYLRAARLNLAMAGNSRTLFARLSTRPILRFFRSRLPVLLFGLSLAMADTEAAVLRRFLTGVVVGVEQMQ